MPMPMTHGMPIHHAHTRTMDGPYPKWPVPKKPKAKAPNQGQQGLANLATKYKAKAHGTWLPAGRPGSPRLAELAELAAGRWPLAAGCDARREALKSCRPSAAGPVPSEHPIISLWKWPAARSYRQKAAILARFKGNNTRRPLFFSACVGMILETTFPLENFRAAKLVVLLSDCKRQSSNSWGNILPPPLTSFERFQPESA
jgi:hypothetical protein